MLQFFKAKFRHHETIHVVKSLNYFLDADTQSDPTSLNNKTWQEVKEIISSALKKYFEDESKKIIL